MAIKRYTYLLLYIIVAFLFTACSEDTDLDNGKYGPTIKVTGSIHTRATGVPEDTTIPEELIKDWWVLLVDNTNTIVKYIDRASTTGSSAAVEREDFSFEVPTGDYIAYSFANISKSTVESLAGSLTVGSAMPDLSGVKYQIGALIADGHNVAGNTIDIPMTGRQEVRFASAGMQFIELEVIRMIAKFEIQFTNESIKDITINSIKMAQSPSDYVPLLPNYTYLDSGWPVGAVVDGNMISSNTPNDKPGAYSYDSGTNTHSVTMSDAHGGPWEAQMAWLTGKATTASDVIDLSFTITADKEIPNVVVKIEQQGNGTIYYVEESIHLNAGVPYNYSKTGMTGKTMSNARLVLGLGGNSPANTTVTVKDLSFKKVVSRSYLRSYDDPLVKTGGKPALAAYTPSSTACAHTFDGSGTCTSCGAKSYTDRFYMRESQANYNIAQRYLMTVNITRAGSTHPEDLLFALTKNLESIYRNDHIVLPLILSDYMVSLDVNFYPPILGYPAVITRESEEEFLCEFATQGTFEIMPKVINASNGYAIVYGTGNPHYTYEIKGISDPNNIFSVTPAIELGTGETIGELSTNEGTAYVDVEVTVHRTGVADQIYERRIYIIRKK